MITALIVNRVCRRYTKINKKKISFFSRGINFSLNNVKVLLNHILKFNEI